MLWQAGGLAWLRGDAARAEELTTEAYELYRRVTPHARHAYAAHQFTLRRADARLADAIPLLVETGDEGSPLLQEMAVLAAAESGDLAEARRLRTRWGRTLVRDWASDVAVYLQAESALLAGRRAGAGRRRSSRCCPTAGGRPCSGRRRSRLGAYDELLGRIAERRGRPRGGPRVVAGGPRAGRARSAPRTRWRWPSRTWPAWAPAPPSEASRAPPSWLSLWGPGSASTVSQDP